MATKNGFYRRTGWVLTREVPPATTLLKMRFAMGTVVDPLRCDHPSPVYNGHIWFCQRCGEPVRDKDERRQAEMDFSTW